MAFSTGTITSSATPTVDLIALVETMLTAHAAWTFVEEYTSGSNVSRVWKNEGALNGFGQDFYIILWRSTTTSTTTLYLLAAEDYNSTTHLCIRACAQPGTTFTPEATYNSAIGATGQVFSNTTWNTVCALTTSTAAFEYLIRVTNNSLLIKSSSGSAYGIGAGLFTPFFPSQPNEFPLAQFQWGNTNTDGSGSVSRRPALTASTTDCFAIYSYATTTTAYESMIGTIADTSQALYQSDGPVGARFLIYHTNPVQGAYRGYLDDIMIFTQHADVGRGDTVEINGEVWVCFDDAGTYGLWMNTETP